MNYQTLKGMARGVGHGMKRGMKRDMKSGMSRRNRRQNFDDLIEQMGLQRQSKSKAGHAMSGVAFFALGIACGSALGMLFAPKKGKELRSEAKDMARDKMSSMKQMTSSHRSSIPGQEQIYERRN